MSTVPGKGATLEIASTAGVDLLVGQVIDIDGPGLVHGTREMTHLGSSAREFSNSIHDAGEVTFNIFYNTTNTGQVQFQRYCHTSAPHTTGVLCTLSLGPSGAKALAFYGIPTGFNFNGFNVDGTAGAACSIKITGLVTLPTTT